MYTKLHCSANWKMISGPTPIPAPLSGMSLIFSPLHSPLSPSSVSYDLRVHIDNHLNDKVFLDLGVLKTSLVSQELPGKEPPLAGHVNFFPFFQLFL